ncbi:MAG TPA: hypothetical protein VKA08_11550 [Balneolales bacterium]|nr:hypothetical protein [Balneolales bacterium]
MKKQVIVLVIILMTGISSVFAQTWNLPANRKNTRFFTDDFNIPRPALSMRGFENLNNDSFYNTYSNTTYGVKQVLERVYGLDGIPVAQSVRQIYIQIINQYRQNSKSLEIFTTNDHKEFNSSVLESRAFLALMSFIIEKNPNIFTSSIQSEIPNMPTHAEAMDSLMAALQRKQGYFTQYD